MKYLVLVAVLVVAWMLWRNARLKDMSQRGPGRGPAPGQPQDMVQCPVCSVHLPRSDAVTGADGLPYCSQEHRLRAGQ
jgi:uncharacterized protein